MDRTAIINRVGIDYHTPNIEGGEYSYVQEAGSKQNLEKAVGKPVSHYKLDIRFECNDVVVLVETKQNFTESDELQLAEYLQEERVLHYGKKIIAILANTKNDRIKVWKSLVDDKHLLIDGRKVTESKYLDDILKLPIQYDDKDNPIIDDCKKYSDKGYIPDWKFMEEYMKSLPYSDRI